MRKNKDRMLGCLLGLTDKELIAIKAVIDQMLAKRSPKSPQYELWIQALADAEGVGDIRLSKAATTALQKNCACAESFVDTLSRTRNRTSKHTIRVTLLNLLLHDLKARKLTPTPGMLATHLPRLPEILDDAFPGYRSAGLTHLIFGGLR